MAALLSLRPGQSPGRERGRLPDRRRVLDAAFGPQRVEAALDLERRALSDVALEHLAVVAHVFDDAHRPVFGQPELFAVIAFGAHELLDIRIVGPERLADA